MFLETVKGRREKVEENQGEIDEKQIHIPS
jgi:hypothetical protein